MFMYRFAKMAMLVLYGIVGLAYAEPNVSHGLAPRLGVVEKPAKVAVEDYVVLPDGAGLPAGSGTAERGERLYQRHCIACHGVAGSGGVNDRLTGGRGSLHTRVPIQSVGSYWPYATTVFDYVRRAMPYNAPGSLTDNEVYSLTAYLLTINDILARDVVLNKDNLPTVVMPNRLGFVWAPK